MSEEPQTNGTRINTLTGLPITQSQPQTHIPTLSRTRVPPAETEEADTHLQLGEFQEVPAISNSEVRVLLDKLMEMRRAVEGGRVQRTEMLNKTMEYLVPVTRFKSANTIGEVDTILQEYRERMHIFEMKQILNLCPSDADEAFTLIPSLKNKFTDGEMDDITKQINDKRHYDT